MLPIEKPFVEKGKEKKEKILQILTENKMFVTRAQLCHLIYGQANESTDRRIRLLVAELAAIHPIVSCSSSKGYKLATCEADLEDAVHCFAENSKRAQELTKRSLPLIKFVESFGRHITTV